MRLYQSDQDYISIYDEYGKVRNEMIFIISKSGYGKGLAEESIAEEFNDAGYVVIVLADPKDELEFAYSMFLPEEKYHINSLNMIGKIQRSKSVKIYHPFTFAIPKNRDLPEINFYTLPLKDMQREEWSMIAETSWDTDTIKLLNKASNEISNDDGIWSFLHYLQDITKGNIDKKEFRPDPKNWFLNVTSGTSKTLQDLSNYFSPFKQNSFLSKKTCKLNLDFKKIMNDPYNYHVFVTNWIKDKKLKEFAILALLNQFIANKDFAKYPILFVLPEMRYLTPFKPQGYKLFLAQGIKDKLSTMRSQGKGMSALCDTQVFSGVDEEVINSATVTFIGELGGARDIEKVGKALKYKRDISNQLARMDCTNSYFWVGQEGFGTFKLWFPSHMHCEPHYNFFDMYKKHFPEKLRRYNVLIDGMKAELKADENLIRERLRKIEEAERKRREAEKAVKETKKAEIEKVESKLEKAQKIQNQSKEQMMRLVYETKQKEPKISLRELSRQFGVNKLTIKRYLETYRKQVDVEEKKDYADEIIEDWNKDDQKEKEVD